LRPYIVASKWGLFEYFIVDPDNSEPFKRCLRNPEVVDGIPSGGNDYATGLWPKILLLRYGWLSDKVRNRFEEKMKDVLREDPEGFRSTSTTLDTFKTVTHISRLIRFAPAGRMSGRHCSTVLRGGPPYQFPYRLISTTLDGT